MSFETRSPLGKSLPCIKLIAARFDGKCACGKLINTGDIIYYDSLKRKTRCRRCGQRGAWSSSQTLEDINESPAQTIINRIKQLCALPEPITSQQEREIQQLRKELLDEFIYDDAARTILFAGVRLPRSTELAMAITAGRSDTCVICFQPQQAGTTVLWDSGSHRIMCVPCSLKQLQAIDSDA